MTDETPSEVTQQLAPAEVEQPLAYRAVHGGLWVALSSYWTVGYGFLANILLTRLLSPEAFGAFALAMFFAQLTRLQPKLGLGYAFAQHKETTLESLGTYVTLEFYAAVAGLALALLAVPVLLRLGYENVVVQTSVLVALAMCMEGIGGIGGTLLDRELRFRPMSIVQSLAFPVSYVPALWLAWRGGGIWSLIAQVITYNLLLLCGIGLAVRREMPHLWRMQRRCSKPLALRFVRFGATIGLGLAASMLLTQLDHFFIGTMVSVTELGFYDRAYRTAQWPALLLTGLLGRAAFFTYARLQGDTARLQKTINWILWIIMTVAMPVALMLVITAPDLLTLLYGERWLPSALFLRLLAPIFAIRPLWENAGALFIALGKPRLTTTFTVAQGIALVLLGGILTYALGAIGTCLAVAITFVGGIAWVLRTMVREVPIRLGRLLGAPLLSALLTLGVYLALSRLTGLNSLALPLRTALKALYAFVAFGLISMGLQPRAMRERLTYVWELFRGGRIARSAAQHGH